MKKSDITVCAVQPVAPPDLGLDLPISERENFLKILKKMFMNLSGVDQDMKRWISMKTQLK